MKVTRVSWGARLKQSSTHLWSGPYASCMAFIVRDMKRLEDIGFVKVDDTNMIRVKSYGNDHIYYRVESNA